METIEILTPFAEGAVILSGAYVLSRAIGIWITEGRRAYALCGAEVSAAGTILVRVCLASLAAVACMGWIVR